MDVGSEQPTICCAPVVTMTAPRQLGLIRASWVPLFLVSVMMRSELMPILVSCEIILSSLVTRHPVVRTLVTKYIVVVVVTR